MVRIQNILLLIFLLGVASCFDPPKFSNTPTISVDGVRIKQVPGASTPDSLIVTVNFKDGDGNIGLDGSENSPPYNERWYYLNVPITNCEQGSNSPCKKISYISSDTSDLKYYVSYKLRRTSPDYDTLPAFVPPYDCTRYYVLKNDNNQPIDTLYNELNSRYNNFFADVLVKNGSSFYKYEFNNAGYPRCDIYGLNGRVPILAKDGNVNTKLPLEGVITYKVTSASFQPLLNKTLKLRIWIMDRDGNVSNIDESNEFTVN